MLTAAGALARLRAEDVPDELLRRARHVHVASPFLQDGLRARAARAGRTARGTTSLDTGWDPRERWDVPVDAFDVLLPNGEEALRLAGRDGRRRRGGGAARSPPAGRSSSSSSAPTARWPCRGGEITRVAAPRVELVDSTGAGDSFDAGFLAAPTSTARGPRTALALGVRVRRAEHTRAPAAPPPADARRGPRARMIAFVAASPSIDRQHEVEALEPGAIHRPTPRRRGRPAARR